MTLFRLRSSEQCLIQSTAGFISEHWQPHKRSHWLFTVVCQWPRKILPTSTVWREGSLSSHPNSLNNSNNIKPSAEAHATVFLKNHVESYQQRPHEHDPLRITIALLFSLFFRRPKKKRVRHMKATNGFSRGERIGWSPPTDWLSTYMLFKVIWMMRVCVGGVVIGGPSPDKMHVTNNPAGSAYLKSTEVKNVCTQAWHADISHEKEQWCNGYLLNLFPASQAAGVRGHGLGLISGHHPGQG